MDEAVQHMNAVNRSGFREALAALDGRLRSELRRSPDFYGDVTVTVTVRKGIITGVSESATVNRQIKPESIEAR
jgi:hypothetical protein